MSFGEISMWSHATVDTIAETKKVVWRPVTASTVLKVGQPVCYNSDLAADYKERATNPLDGVLGAGDETTYAEGAQTYNARFLVVEEPLTANLHAYAGIVKALGPKAGADGDTIEIYVPKEGAVVPVYCAQNCTLDRTIMGIRNGQADVDYPGRAIGVAKETKDRSSTDGLVWMEFKKFDYQVINSGGDATANALIVDDESAANSVLLNSVNVRFDGSALYNRVRFEVGEIAGGGGALNGMFKFRTYVSSTVTTLVQVVCGNLHVKDDGVLIHGSGEYHSAFYATIETETTTTPGSALGAHLCAYQACYYFDETTGAPESAHVIGVPNGTPHQWDGLLITQTIAALGGQACTGDVTVDANDLVIPIRVADTTYYLIAVDSIPAG